MSFEIEAIIRVLCALIFGGLIGYEREYRNMPAGFRTHILVCIGSALVMMTSEFMFYEFSEFVNLDPARLGAQVISGIGFLGAGTILRDKFRVTGLTTAASLWAVACIGLAVGIGYYYMATVSTIVIFVTLSFLRKFEGKLLSCKVTKLKITLSIKLLKGHENDTIQLVEKMGYELMKITTFREDGERVFVKYELECTYSPQGTRALIEKMMETPYIISADIH